MKKLTKAPKLGAGELFVADCRHDSSADSEITVCATYDDAVDVIMEHFESYGCSINKDGVPVDESDKTDSFSEVVMYNGRVAGFVHCEGEGPVAHISRVLVRGDLTKAVK